MKKFFLIGCLVVSVVFVVTSCSTFNLFEDLTSVPATSVEQEVDVSTTYYETYDKFTESAVYGMRNSTGKYSNLLFQFEVEKTTDGLTWYLWVSPVNKFTESEFSVVASTFGSERIETKYELISAKKIALPAIVVDDVAGRFTIEGIQKKTVFGQDYTAPAYETVNDMHSAIGYTSVSSAKNEWGMERASVYKIEVSEQFVKDIIAFLLNCKNASVKFTDSYGTLSNDLIFDIEKANLEAISYFNDIMIEKGIL